MKIKKYISFTTLLSTMLFYVNILAILDGRLNPIHLDTRYTFSNYEWARGSVYFRKGFDLPPGGTVFLGIDSGFVGDDIDLKGGTMTLETDISLMNEANITGSGFIDAQNNSFFYQTQIGLFSLNDKNITFLSSIKFVGTEYSRFSPLGTLNFSSVVGDVSFLLGNVVIFSSRIQTSATHPSHIIFSGCNVLQGGNPSSINPPVIFYTKNRLTANTILTLNLVTITTGASLLIESGSTIKLSGLDIQFETPLLTIKNSTLDFISTNNNPIEIGNPPEQPGSITEQGNIELIGTNRFLSSTGNQLIIDPRLTLEFTAGSRLEIADQTHIAIK